MATKLTFDNLEVVGDLAFSVRKLRTSSVNCMRVRESGGDTLADIPFYGNVIDRQALIDHCGANDGFVHTWYGQDATGVNATQTTNSLQPQIVSSGDVVEVNGMPAVDFLSSSRYLRTSSGPSLASTAYTIAAVFQFNTDPATDNSQAVWDGESNASWLGMGGTSTLRIAHGSSPFYIDTSDTGDTNQTTWVWKNTAYRLNDDASDTAMSSVTHTMNGITIGQLRSGSEGVGWELEGYVQEIVRYASTAISLADIQDDQRDFFIRHIVPVTNSAKRVGIGGGWVG